MYRALLTLAWVIGPIYATIPLFWLIVQRFRERLRARHGVLRIIIPCWFAMMTLVYFMTCPWREIVLYRALLAWLAAGLLFAAAILIYHHSRLRFPRIQELRRRTQLESHAERRLISSGIRQQIRHPIYLAHLCMLLAWTVGSGEVVLYALTILALVTGWPMIRQEEAELEHRFGDEYRAYKRAVPAALLPRIFRWGKERQRQGTT